MPLSAKKLKVGDTHSETVVENLHRTQLVMYSGTSGDYNPLHSDEVFATKVAGYPSVFSHGMLSMRSFFYLTLSWTLDCIMPLSEKLLEKRNSHKSSFLML